MLHEEHASKSVDDYINQKQIALTIVNDYRGSEKLIQDELIFSIRLLYLFNDGDLFILQRFSIQLFIQNFQMISESHFSSF